MEFGLGQVVSCICLYKREPYMFYNGWSLEDRRTRIYNLGHLNLAQFRQDIARFDIYIYIFVLMFCTIFTH